MKHIVDWVECQRDSPEFRQVIEENEKNLEVLEVKLEKVVKQCHQMVQAGKVFNNEESQLLKELWDLSDYFSSDSVVQASLNTMLDSLRELASFHRILIDQATRTISKNFKSFIKNELKNIKDSQGRFEKSSTELDTLLQRASSKVNDADDLDIHVVRTRKAFRHNAIDYVSAISLAQGRKRYEIVYSIMSYLKAFNTFYHQGTDHLSDLEPNIEQISQDVNKMQSEVEEMKDEMKSVHFKVTGDPILESDEDQQNDSNIAMQGYLFKRSNNAFKSWNHRYFTLQNNQLVYRKRTGDDVTVMEEDLRLCNVKPAVDVDRRFCFEVTSNTKVHLLQADSEESRLKWIEALQKAIAIALDQPFTSHLDDSLHNSSRHQSSPIQSPLCPSHNRSASDSPSQRSTGSTVWEAIIAVPGNDLCCDCQSPNPKWASINLGITLCIECSGIHRSLGVHYSKVRSLTLDNWDYEVLCLMERLGNSVINQIYLSKFQDIENLGRQFSPATPQCSRAIREEWIRAKYVQKLFVLSSDDNISLKKTLQTLLSYRRRTAKRKKFIHSDSTQSSPRLNKSSPIGVSSSSLSLDTSLTSPSSCPTLNSLEGDIASEISFKVPPDIQDPVSELTEDEEASSTVEKFEKFCHSPNDLLKKSANNSNIPFMALALAMKAEKNHRCDLKKTALHYAVLSGSSIAVEYLLLNGAQVNAQDLEQKTPLHLAAQNSNIFQVYRLLMYRAPQDLKDLTQCTPLELAVKDGEPDLVTLLRVATLSDQLEWDAVEKEIRAIMVEIHHNREVENKP